MVEIAFGLKAQGHIETIERMLDEVKAPPHAIWERIGDKIGWCPLTAAAYYVNYLRENQTSNSEQIPGDEDIGP